MFCIFFNLFSKLVQPMKRGSWYSVAVASELFLTNFGIGDSFSLGWGENLVNINP